jgi:non-ribosomal peptide synthetase component F
VHPGVFAAKEPERPAVIMGAAGTVMTYAELEARSNQVAWPGASRLGNCGRRWVRSAAARCASNSAPRLARTGRGRGYGSRAAERYWRAMCMRSSASVSSISFPLTSTVTLSMMPVNLKGLA